MQKNKNYQTNRSAAAAHRRKNDEAFIGSTAPRNQNINQLRSIEGSYVPGKSGPADNTKRSHLLLKTKPSLQKTKPNPGSKPARHRSGAIC